MEINGNILADQIREHIRLEAEKLVNNGIRAHLAIITVGNNDDWATYVKQKLKWAERLSMKATVFEVTESTQAIIEKIDELNQDDTVHGIIVQRPLPKSIDSDAVTQKILPLKDVDGFRSDSPFEVPVWMAVRYILTSISQDFEDTLESYLKGKRITIIGKGETAGTPIIHGLKYMGIQPLIIDSTTADPEKRITESDIVISCVGKRVITKDTIQDHHVLIGVGIRTENGKLKGDFENADAQEKQAIYTPTPGGVGPVNLTFLFQNLIQAAHLQRHPIVN